MRACRQVLARTVLIEFAGWPIGRKIHLVELCWYECSELCRAEDRHCAVGKVHKEKLREEYACTHDCHGLLPRHHLMLLFSHYSNLTLMLDCEQIRDNNRDQSPHLYRSDHLPASIGFILCKSHASLTTRSTDSVLAGVEPILRSEVTILSFYVPEAGPWLVPVRLLFCAMLRCPCPGELKHTFREHTWRSNDSAGGVPWSGSQTNGSVTPSSACTKKLTPFNNKQDVDAAVVPLVS